MNANATRRLRRPDKWLSATSTTPLLDALRRDVDLAMLDRNLALSTEERALQLTKATRAIERLRVQSQSSQ